MKFNFKILSLLIFLSIGYSNAQSVRSLNNDGVDLYKEKKFTDSEIHFKKGLNEAPNNFEANFNLGDSYYKQERYDEAIKTFQNSLDKSDDPALKAKVYHNIGNALLKSKKIKESIEAYKNSLKLNPDDQETKYNLSYALSLLKKQNQQQQNQNKNKDQNKDQNKNDKNNRKQNDKNDKQKNKQDQNKPDDQKAQNDNVKQTEKNKISKAEAERILEALKNNEKDLQRKLRKQEGKAVKTDKDW